jgi:hypothetical protein
VSGRAAFVRPGRDPADAGSVNVHAVCFAALHHLGIPGDDLDPGFLGSFTHRSDHSFQDGHFQPFFQDEAGGQVQRLGAQHGYVIDRAAHRQPPDIPAGEKQRRNHV